MPLDHFTVKVPKDRFDEVVEFYAKVLAGLGYTEGPGFPGVASMLVNGYPDFWIMAKEGKSECDGHYAFKCKDRATVRKVYEDSLSAGGRSNGEPGPRKGYLPTYFCAYFFDPVGNNVEAATANAE